MMELLHVIVVVQLTLRRAPSRRWENFYDEDWPESPFKMPDGMWTPAEVSAILFNSFGEPMAAIEHLASQKPREIGEAIELAVPGKKSKSIAA